MQIGLLAEPTFNVMYAMYSLLLIRYPWWTARNSRCFEPAAQAVVWTVALSYGLIPVAFRSYNNSGQVCWFSPYPSGCDVYATEDSGTVPCEYGSNYPVVLAPTVIYVSLCVVTGGVFMYYIYKGVYEQENRIARYSSSWREEDPSSGNLELSSELQLGAVGDGSGDGAADPSDGSFRDDQDPSENIAIDASSSSVNRDRDISAHSTTSTAARISAATRNRARSRAVRLQAIYYMTAFLLSYLLPFIQYVVMLTDTPVPPPLDFFAFILMPMQGFFNLVVFCRNKRVDEMRTMEGRLVRAAFGHCMACYSALQRYVTSYLCCCCHCFRTTGGDGEQAQSQREPGAAGATVAGRGPTSAMSAEAKSSTSDPFPRSEAKSSSSDREPRSEAKSGSSDHAQEQQTREPDTTCAGVDDEEEGDGHGGSRRTESI